MHRVLTHAFSSLLTGFYDPKTFLTHAASLHQGFPHCGSLSTAASRRSLGRISVPVWPDTLSGRLPIVALVSRYLTNKLIGRGTIFERQLETEAIFHRVRMPGLGHMRY